MKFNSKDKIEDLSFSNLVTLIHKDEKEAKKCLLKLAYEMEFVKDKIQIFEKQLNYFKGRKESLINASHNICNMIEKTIPLAIIQNDHIVVVSEKGISVETNVL